MIKRITALILAALLAASLCGCGDEAEGVDEIVIIGEAPEVTAPYEDSSEAPADTVIASCGDFCITSALYRLFILRELEKTGDEYGLELEELSGRQVLDDDGTVMKAEELAEKNAAFRVRKLYLAFEEINRLGGSINACSGYSSTAAAAGDAYTAGLNKYDALGISLQELVIEQLEDSIYSYLFSLIYGEGGEREIPREELEEIMQERMRRVEYTFLPFYDDETMELFSAKRIKELKAQSADYLKRYKAGEDFSEIVKENYLLLAGYELFFDVENTEVYYSVLRGDFAREISEGVEALKDGEAKIINAEYYSAVVLRMPINENEDGRWLGSAMTEAYYSPYGKEFNSNLTELLSQLPDAPFSQLINESAEKVIKRLS